MIVLRNKEFSKFGRFMAGTKGAVKKGAKGALWGSVLVPGNGLALICNKPKLALGITAAGAAIGAGIGGKLGWKEGINQYRYDNDPEYRKEVDKEREEQQQKMILNLRKEDEFIVASFRYQSWKKLNDKIKVIPTEFLNYVKFYDTIWHKKVNPWYDAMDPKLDLWDIPQFKEVFPVPIESELTEEWYKNDDLDFLCLATVNSAGDDGYLCYDPESKEYGWDMPGNSKSLKEILLNNVKRYEQDDCFTPAQKKLVSEFKNKIKTL